MAQRKSTKIVSKKHLARLERERRQTRAIMIGSIVILAIVLLSIVYGALSETILLNYKTIVTVNGEKVTVHEFQAQAKASREQLIDQYMYYYQLAMMFGMDPSTDSSLSQLFSNIEYQLSDAKSLADQVLTSIEDTLLVKQYGIANGITVTEADVEDAIRNTYGYFPNGTQTPTPTSTLLAYSTLSAAQLDLVTATPTLEPTFTPTLGPTLTATLEGTAAPSATPMTEQGYTELYADALVHYRTLGYNEEMFRRVFFEDALYRERVKALVTADVPHEAEKVWARHILVADQATAETVYTLLMAGGDFATLAAAYSTDGTKDIGGDLGWFGTGEMVAEFETAAFSLEIGEISQPVQSQHGFHIIQVLGHENRPLTDSEYQTAVDAAFDAWLAEQRAAATIVVIDNYMDFTPDKPTLQDAFNNMFATQTAAAPTYLAQQQTSDAELALTPSATPLPPTVTP
ncbi:MAG: peptidylprolyl isomerase [Chloroflexi bacterium]|nr:peptidylprolyl isomerase [Chloroflexota bacterium]